MFFLAYFRDIRYFCINIRVQIINNIYIVKYAIFNIKNNNLVNGCCYLLYSISVVLKL